MKRKKNSRKIKQKAKKLNFERMDKAEYNKFMTYTFDDLKNLLEAETHSGNNQLSKILFATGDEQLISFYIEKVGKNFSDSFTSDDWQDIFAIALNSNNLESIEYLLKCFSKNIFGSVHHANLLNAIYNSSVNIATKIKTLEAAYQVQPKFVKKYAYVLLMSIDESAVEIISCFPDIWQGENDGLLPVHFYLFLVRERVREKEKLHYSELYEDIHMQIMLRKRGKPTKNIKEEQILKNIAVADRKKQTEKLNEYHAAAKLEFKALNSFFSEVSKPFNYITDTEYEQLYLRLFYYHQNGQGISEPIEQAQKLIKNILGVNRISDRDIIHKATFIYLASGLKPSIEGFKNYWQSKKVNVSNDIIMQMTIANKIAYECSKALMHESARENSRKAIEIYEHQLSVTQKADYEKTHYCAQYNLLMNLDMNTEEAGDLLRKIAKRSKNIDEDLICFIERLLNAKIYYLAAECAQNVSDNKLKSYLEAFVDCSKNGNIEKIQRIDRELFDSIINKLKAEMKLGAIDIMQKMHNAIELASTSNFSLQDQLNISIELKNLAGASSIVAKSYDKDMARQLLNIIENGEVNKWLGVDDSIILPIRIISNMILEQYNEAENFIMQLGDEIKISGIYKMHLIDFLLGFALKSAGEPEKSELLLNKAKNLAGKSKKYKAKLKNAAGKIAKFQAKFATANDEKSADQDKFMTKDETSKLTFDDLVQYATKVEQGNYAGKFIHQSDYFALVHYFHSLQDGQESLQAAKQTPSQYHWQFANQTITSENSIIYPIQYKQKTLFAAIEPKLYNSLDGAFQVALRNSLSKGAIPAKSLGINGVKFIGSLAEIKTSFSDRIVADEVIFNQDDAPLLVFSKKMGHEAVKRMNEIGKEVAGLKQADIDYDIEFLSGASSDDCSETKDAGFVDISWPAHIQEECQIIGAYELGDN